MWFWLIILSYLLGSIPTGKLVGLAHGIDIQKRGSGNIGFANSVRVMGWRSGAIVLVGDVFKGFFSVYLALDYLSYNQSLIVGLAAIIGHVFPVWLKFRGGKGVATGLGISLALAPLVAVLGLATYILGLRLFRKSGPSSVFAGWSLSVFAILYEPRFLWFSLLLGLIGTWTHRTNLRQFMKGRHDR